MEWNGGVDYGMDYMEASCAADITISHCVLAFHLSFFTLSDLREVSSMICW